MIHPGPLEAPLRSRWRSFSAGVLFLAMVGATTARADGPATAEWFPEQSSAPRYNWTPEPCAGCTAMDPKMEWRAMASLAGVREIRFLLAPGEENGPAYSFAPNTVVLTPSALALEPCQLNFLVGHELVHIALRHFDEDALTMAALSGRTWAWTQSGNEAVHLLDDNFPLAFRMAGFWQLQEREADWAGALLAAQACGCRIEESALPYLRSEEGYGGGIAAAHESSAERVRFLQTFADSAQRLVEQNY